MTDRGHPKFDDRIFPKQVILSAAHDVFIMNMFMHMCLYKIYFMIYIYIYICIMQCFPYVDMCREVVHILYMYNSRSINSLMLGFKARCYVVGF